VGVNQTAAWYKKWNYGTFARHFRSKEQKPQTEFLQMENLLCIQVLCYPFWVALLHGTRAAGVIQTLRRGTRKFGRAAIMWYVRAK